MDDALYKEVISSIKAIFDMTTRLDERIKMLLEKQHDTDNKISNIFSSQADLNTKVSVLETSNGPANQKKTDDIFQKLAQLETRLSNVEKSATNTEAKWKAIFDFVYKTIWVVVVCYLLYLLNLSTPPLP